MQRLLPRGFQFSALTTFTALAIAAIMCWASHWQWTRYLAKKELVETYSQFSKAQPLEFPAAESDTEDTFHPVMYRKVHLSGSYDYDHEMIVINRLHVTGPGYWLLTPLKISGSDRSIIVVRGFIPFADSTPETWKKYRFASEETFSAVVQPTVPQQSWLSPGNDDTGEGHAFVYRWLFPDIASMAKQLPYPLITSVFVQRLGPPPQGEFPAEAVSIEVPPSTHFGYTIEWIILACVTLIIAFVLQAFPQIRDRFRRGPRS